MTRERLAASVVFTPTDFPHYTYVPRDTLHHERLLREWARTSTQIASVSGPSKAGKTVLVQRVIGKENLITVSGASVRAPDQLWERVLDWCGEPHSTMASRTDTLADAAGKEHSFRVGTSGTGAATRGHSQTTSTGADLLSATSQRRGLPQVVDQLANTRYTLLLDDFHYIPLAIQSDVAQQLKDAASRGVRICVASVPHRSDNVVRALPELRGRVVAVDLDYWSVKDLLEIPRMGLEALRFSVDAQSLTAFAREAAGSPQLMQSICKWMCESLEIHESLPEPKAFVLDAAKRRGILEMSSFAADFRTLVRALIAGPRARPGERQTYAHNDGKQGDVYLTIMRAIAMDPPRLAIHKDELTKRLDELCKGKNPDGASVVRACIQLGQIAQSTYAAHSGPSLEWDEQDSVLVLPDPYLLFYLRCSGLLEREADAADAPDITTS
ncbi:MAG: hypothetical protein AB7T06_04340 [Kofleriaceae bacterium]